MARGWLPTFANSSKYDWGFIFTGNALQVTREASKLLLLTDPEGDLEEQRANAHDMANGPVHIMSSMLLADGLVIGQVEALDEALGEGDTPLVAVTHEAKEDRLLVTALSNEEVHAFTQLAPGFVSLQEHS